MENRRAYYRHAFPPGERLAVDMETAEGHKTYHGEIIDLSLGGLQVRLDGPAPPLTAEDRLIARLALPGLPQRPALPAAVRHWRIGDGEVYCGLAFRSFLAGPADEERERLLWRFLYEEQTRAIRKAKEENLVAS